MKPTTIILAAILLMGTPAFAQDMEATTDVQVRPIQVRAELRAENRSEMRDEMKEDREEMRDDMEEKREERQEIVRKKRGDVVARLSNNIVLRLESGVRKITQIEGRTQTAIDNMTAKGEDMSVAQIELDNASTFLVSAETDITAIKALVSTWSEFDVSSDTFAEELNNQKENLRELMRSAHENLKSAGSSIRTAIKAIKEVRTSVATTTEAEVETE